LLNNIGGVYEVLGEPYKALEHYGEALTIWPTVENRRAHGDTLNNVGVIYYNMGQPQKALDYYLQALMLKREVGDPSRIATTLANIANVYATPSAIPMPCLVRQPKLSNTTIRRCRCTAQWATDRARP
jgi:tetratricopeptide (TPR) repeat protein